MKSITFFAIIAFVSSAAAQNITTIAGGGPHNLPALQTGLPSLSGIAADNAGNIYVSLQYSHQIWKIDSIGKVNVYAGSGNTSFSFLSSSYLGDGGPALNASFCNPSGLALDSVGNLFVADSCNYRIRKISTTGIITTVAGTGGYGNSGDGGPATAATFGYVSGVTLDSANNLYIVDRGNQEIRMVAAASGNVTTVAGNGLSGFSGDGGPATMATLSSPTGVAVDSTGNLYIADSGNNRVRKVSAGIIKTIAGTGVNGYTGDGSLATLAQLSGLVTVAVDQFNDVFILEASDVREIPAGQNTIVTFAGGAAQAYSGDGGGPASATFSYLTAMAFDSSFNLYLADQGNNRVRKITLSNVSTVAGNGTQFYSGDGQLGTNILFQYVDGLAVDNLGSLYFPDSNLFIRKLLLSNDTLSTLVGNGSYGYTPDSTSFSGPISNVYTVRSDSKNHLYIFDQNRLRKISNGAVSTLANLSGAYGDATDGSLAISAPLQYPSDLAVAPNGDIYIADTRASKVRMITAATGIISTVAGNGTQISSGDGGQATAASIPYPNSLAFDGLGNLFVLEGYPQYRVRRVNLTTGIITTFAGGGNSGFIDGVPATNVSLYSVSSLFADQSGNLFFVDSYSNRVRKVTASSGIISTVAGSGSPLSSGDGGPAAAAGMTPVAITIDRSQNLYISDNGKIRVTQVQACFFTLSAPTLSVTKAAATGSFTLTATNSNCPYSVTSGSSAVTFTSGATGTGNGTVTFSVSANTGIARTINLTVAGQLFTITQAGTSIQTNIGFFQPNNGSVWALDANGNGVFDGNGGGDKYFPFAGQPGAIAVVGDWNGDGRSKVGFYLNGFWVLDYNGNGVWDGPNGGDKFFAYGGAGYTPVVGDWTGTGTTKIGYWYNGFWVLDLNGDGVYETSDAFYGYGGNGPGEQPLVGDWNGDGRAKIGFYFKGAWALDANGDGTFNSGDKYYTGFTYSPVDKPVTGDWSGTGTTKIGIYRSGFWVLDYNGNGTFDGIANGDKFYGFGGDPSDVPLTADWNGDGKTKIGVYRNGYWLLDFNGNGVYDGTGVGQDRFLGFYGGPGSQPLIGRW